MANLVKIRHAAQVAGPGLAAASDFVRGQVEAVALAVAALQAMLAENSQPR